MGRGGEEAGSPTNPMLYDPIPSGTGDARVKMQLVAATIISFGAISAGTALAWTSPFISQNKNHTLATFPMTPEQESWVGSFLAIGAIIGAVPAGILADKIGRKLATMTLAVPFIVSWILIIFASGPGMMYCGRFLGGIATGGYCVVCPMYISEIADISIRGTLGSFFQLFLTIGILFVYLIGSIMSWETLSSLCAIFPIGLIIFMVILPESPTYLLKQGRRNDASVALKWLWGAESNTQAALQSIQSDLDAVSGKVSVKDMLSVVTYRTALFISLSLMFFQQFSGINAVIFYTDPIFASSGSTLSPSLCSIIVGVVQVLMTFVSAMLIEKAGRRILLLQSSVVMGACLITLGFYYHFKDPNELISSIGWLPLLAVVSFIISFSLGFGPIPWMMMGELFAPDVKSIASSIAVMFNWILVFLVTKTFTLMQDGLGSDVTFWFYGVWMIVCTIFVAIKVPETKGKSNAEIQLMLSERVARRRPVSQKYIPMNAEL